MLIVGLTGGIASGKSTVEQLFRAHGTPVIDADAIARQLLQPGEPALAQVVGEFGRAILDRNGALDRSQMRTVIFNDPQARKRLEAIVHPLVAEHMQQRLGQLQAIYAILSVPLLLESGQHQMVDRILVVDLPTELQMQRLMARDHCDAAAAGRMLAAQLDRHSRLQAANDIIDNSGPVERLAPQVDKLHQSYLEPPA